MTTTVNELGQLELPPEVATKLGLKPGDHVEIETLNGQCIVRPVRLGSGIRWEGNVLVHDGVGGEASLVDLREDRLVRLGEGRSG